jgi:hypothetical protein
MKIHPQLDGNLAIYKQMYCQFLNSLALYYVYTLSVQNIMNSFHDRLTMWIQVESFDPILMSVITSTSISGAQSRVAQLVEHGAISARVVLASIQMYALTTVSHSGKEHLLHD